MAAFARSRLLNAFPAPKPRRPGFRKQPLRARICAEPVSNPYQTHAGIQNPLEIRPQSGFAAARPEIIASFATGLIAAKPVKPCDGGVFGALDLLSKPEQNGLERG